MESKNWFENDEKFEYMRFPISSHTKSPFDMKQASGILKFFYPVFDLIERKTNSGQNVLIHCIAGAHRSGSTGVAWLIYEGNLSADKATELAKSKRSIIDPWAGFFDTLMEDLSQALQDKQTLETIKKDEDPKELLNQI